MAALAFLIWDNIPRGTQITCLHIERSCTSGYSNVRRFKQQAQKYLACPSSYSAWPPLGKAGGTIMKRRLIML
jgi:hypothetical protein